MEETFIDEFESQWIDVKAIDHNGNYDYRYIQFLYDKIQELDSTFRNTIKVMEGLRR